MKIKNKHKAFRGITIQNIYYNHTIKFVISIILTTQKYQLC
jgi:hypothetical protein